MERNIITAIKAAQAGFNIFPIIGKGDNYKQPIWGFKWGSDATNNINIIKSWIAKYDYFMPCISLKNSRYFVVDTDVKNNIDGLTPFIDLLQQHNTDINNIAQTYTPSGGRHFYFKIPNEIDTITNYTGNLPDGIDIRGNTSCVIARSTITKEGKVYAMGNMGRIKITDTIIAPQWLIKLITPPIYTIELPKYNNNITQSNDQFITNELERYKKNALNYVYNQLITTPKGNRNNNLFKMAAYLGKLIGANVLTYSEAYSTLLSISTQIGITGYEAQRTINSGLTKGSREPLDLTKLIFNVKVKYD